MKIISKYRNSFGDYVTREIKVLEINDAPRNIRGQTSLGNWAVDFIVPAPVANGQQWRSDYFWRKADAIDFINQVKAA